MVYKHNFTGKRTLKNIFKTSKDKNNIQIKSEIIYWYRYSRLECNEEYIGESSKIFGERLKEHLKVPPPIYDRQSKRGYSTSVEDFNITSKEGQNLARSSMRPFS